MSGRRLLLATCALLATVEQPIGHSMEGFVARTTVWWCYPFIKIEREVVNGTTGARIGTEARDFYALPADHLATRPTPTAPHQHLYYGQ